MIFFDVRDDGEHGSQLEERPVVLVGFRNEPFALAQASVGAEVVRAAADEYRRIEARGHEDRADHRGRRGFSVRPGDRDALLQAHDLAEHLGPSNHGDGLSRVPAELRRCPRRARK